MMKTEVQEIAPNVTEIESLVLGMIINTGTETFEIVSTMIKPDMFFDPVNQGIFGVMSAMYSAHEPIRLETVARAARNNNNFKDITPQLLAHYAMAAPATERDIEKYCRMIAETYATRYILRQIKEIESEIYTSFPLDEVLSKIGHLDNEVNEILAGGETGHGMTELLLKTLETQDKKIINCKSGKPGGIPTGFKKLDWKIGGFAPGTFTILAGRPGSGKTSLGLHFAEIAAKNNVPVLFFSFEMTATQIGEIFISRCSGIDRTVLRDGQTDQYQLNDIQISMNKISSLPIRIFDNPSLTVTRIELLTKRYIKRYGTAIVLIDYLQLIPPEDRKVIREQQVSTISRHLKKISIGLNIPVICMAQLNREGASGEPQLNHLRESGALEQDADVVMLVWRLTPEEVQLAEIPNIDKLLKLKIAKNRHGEPGMINIYHNGQFTAFSENEIIRQEEFGY